MKVSHDYKKFGSEINTMKRIFKKSKLNNPTCTTPEVVDFGLILLTDKPQEEAMMAYMIMPRYGHNLDFFFEKRNNTISKSNALAIGLAAIDMLQSVHAAGYIYNDLKLDNLMTGYKDAFSPEKDLQDSSIHLVDFGFATRFTDKETKNHISC
jgi:serine/threonine protein kinase